MKNLTILLFIVILMFTSCAFDVYLPIVSKPQVTFTPTDTATNTPVITATITPTITPTSTLPPGVYSFTDGYGGNVDTGMDVNMHSTAHDRNGGQHDAIQFGNYNFALIKFNLASLPENAIIQQATLYLGTTGVGSANIYAVLPTNIGWIEGTGNLEPAKRGEPCWDALASDGQGGILTPWAGGMNGAGVVGVDIGSNPAGVLSASMAGVHAVVLNVTALMDWVGANNVNAGILIKPTTTNSNHIALAEYQTANLRPKLVVVYQVPSSANNAPNGTQKETLMLPSKNSLRHSLAMLE